jgi:hypothetical protein
LSAQLSPEHYGVRKPANQHASRLNLLNMEPKALAVVANPVRAGTRRRSPMRINWLYTTAVALVIGTGAAIAQAPDAAQKRDEGTRAQSPAAQSKEMDRPAAKERGGQAEQKEQKGGPKDMQRGEGPGERSKQAQEPAGRAGKDKEPTRQSKEQGRDQDRRDRPAADTAQKGKDQPKAGDAKQQATDEKMRGREDRSKDRAQDTKQPADARQQPQQQTDRDRRDQKDQKDQTAQQPAGTSTQQSGRPSDATQDRQGQKTGQAADQTNQRTTSVNDDQRKQIVDQLRRDRSASTNINVRVNIGERLPPRVQPRRLPADIVRIAPQYRNYEYTVIDNRVVIVDPRRREVIDILDEGPGYGRAAGYSRERIVFTGEQRTRWRELARSGSTTVGSTSPSGAATSSSGGALAANCLSLQPVPEEMVRDRPELSSYRYLAIGNEIVLVDPQQQKIVQVID